MRITICIEDQSLPQRLETHVEGLEHMDDITLSLELDRLRHNAEREIRDRLKRDRIKWPELAPITKQRRL